MYPEFARVAEEMYGRLCGTSGIRVKIKDL